MVAEITAALTAHVEAELPNLAGRLRVGHNRSILSEPDGKDLWVWHVYLDEFPQEWPAPHPKFHWGFAMVDIGGWTTPDGRRDFERRFDGLVMCLQKQTVEVLSPPA